MKFQTLLTFAELIAKYGVPAAVSIIAAWKIEGAPTQEDINRLKQMVPKPGTYFVQDS
jgi:hypothetical protein